MSDVQVGVPGPTLSGTAVLQYCEYCYSSLLSPGYLTNV